MPGEGLQITVITAVWNAADTLGAALAAFDGQSHPQALQIVVDGASQDGSLQILQAAAHPRRRLISEPDRGIYDALNKGIRVAPPGVIGILHSDDLYPDAGVLARVASAFEDPEVLGVYGDLTYVARTDPRRVIRHWQSGPFRPQRLKYGWMPPHPALYLRRSVYERFGLYDTGFRIAADYDFLLRVLPHLDGRLRYLPEVLSTMRIGGISNRNPARILEKSREDYLALRRSRAGGLGTLACKNLRKIGQFLPRI